MPGGGWVTTHEDVTERRHAEDQVREQKLQMDAALDNISQGLLMFDGDGAAHPLQSPLSRALQPGAGRHEARA